MRNTFLFLLVCVATGAGGASPPQGRWEGAVDIPGRRLPLVVDLAQDDKGAWAGSIIVPGLGIKGVALGHLEVTDEGVSFDTGTALTSLTQGPAAFNARLTELDSMAGEMRQGGNAAHFSLRKIGAAQVEAAARSTTVAREIEDQWTGDFELGGYPRHVTITLENRAGTGATAKFVIVGRQTTNLPVDLVVEDGDLLRIESQATRVAFEGRVLKDSGEIRGIIELGSLELPLSLRRGTGGKS